MMPAPTSGNGQDLSGRLHAAEAQLHIYARDFGRLLAAEREKAKQLEDANRQLQVYARDLRSLFEAEQRRSHELEKSHRDSLLRLLRASRFKDNETGSHLRRVKQLSKIVACHCGWSEADASLFAEASPMHDVGKIAVPDAILHKSGPLTPEEWKIMQQHPAFGAMLLRGSVSPLFEMAREIALSHHERWDGSGYPRGLRGNGIPFTARMLSIIDCYDALRTQRPYKPPFTHAKTCDIIFNGDGRTSPQHFDPDILQAFRDLQNQFAAVHARLYQ